MDDENKITASNLTIALMTANAATGKPAPDEFDQVDGVESSHSPFYSPAEVMSILYRIFSDVE